MVAPNGRPDGKSGEQLGELGQIDGTSILEVAQVPTQAQDTAIDLAQAQLLGDTLSLQSALLATRIARKLNNLLPQGATKPTQKCFKRLLKRTEAEITLAV